MCSLSCWIYCTHAIRANVSLHTLRKETQLRAQARHRSSAQELQGSINSDVLALLQGPRNCLGQHLALLEARVVLALLTQRFKFTPTSAAAGERHPTVIPVASLDGMPCTLE